MTSSKQVQHIQELVCSPSIWVFIGVNYIVVTRLEIGCSIYFVTTLILIQEISNQSCEKLFMETLSGSSHKNTGIKIGDF